jgi:hypothetical protein
MSGLVGRRIATDLVVCFYGVVSKEGMGEGKGGRGRGRDRVHMDVVGGR